MDDLLYQKQGGLVGAKFDLFNIKHHLLYTSRSLVFSLSFSLLLLLRVNGLKIDAAAH